MTEPLVDVVVVVTRPAWLLVLSRRPPGVRLAWYATPELRASMALALRLLTKMTMSVIIKSTDATAPKAMYVGALPAGSPFPGTRFRGKFLSVKS